MDKILQESLKKWWSSDGNNTYAINHPLNENSVVVELGGFDGSWVSLMNPKYNSKFYVLEPIKSFYNNIVNRFSTSPNITPIHAGLSSEDKKTIIYKKGDETTLHKKVGVEEEIQLWSLETLLKNINEAEVDLMQINIEGEEYPLLENLINKDVIHNVKRIQIQFHTFVDDYENRRLKIREGLIKCGYKNVYNFPFVFECWEK